VSPLVPDTRGGRVAAETALAQVAPQPYAASRNFLAGAVTRLSAYLRHGVVSLAEVRDAALRAELGWRDYWQRVYAAIGDGMWQNREPATSGEPPASYAQELPPDIAEGRARLACIDAFCHDRIVTTASPRPRFRAMCDQLTQQLPVEALPVPPFVTAPGVLDLKRFGHYWRDVEAATVRLTGAK
jgi:deoxyribodipyrimidine photolyase